jgi:hypothetical protein
VQSVSSAVNSVFRRENKRQLLQEYRTITEIPQIERKDRFLHTSFAGPPLRWASTSAIQTI